MSRKIKNLAPVAHATEVAAAAPDTAAAPESAAVMHVVSDEQSQDEQPAAQVEQSQEAAAPAQDEQQPAQVITVEGPAPRSLDELLQMVAAAQAATGRFTALKATAEKLSGFIIGREGYNDRLTIKDGQGQEWNTSQSVVIQKVLDVLRTELAAAIAATEAELRATLVAA